MVCYGISHNRIPTVSHALSVGITDVGRELIIVAFEVSRNHKSKLVVADRKH